MATGVYLGSAQTRHTSITFFLRPILRPGSGTTRPGHHLGYFRDTPKVDVVGKCERGFKMRLKSTIRVILDPPKRVSLSRLWNLPTTSKYPVPRVGGEASWVIETSASKHNFRGLMLHSTIRTQIAQAYSFHRTTCRCHPSIGIFSEALWLLLFFSS